MKCIDASRFSDETLLAHDTMMVRAYLLLDQMSGLAMQIWGEVLEELQFRGKVKLISGTFDDIGNALIERI